MRYVVARFVENQRELTYRLYLTTAIQNALGIKKGWYDFAYPKEQDDRSPEELIAEVMKGGGFHFKGSEESDIVRDSGQADAGQE